MESRDTPSVTPDGAVALPFYDGQSDSTAQLVSSASGSPVSPRVVAFAGFRGPVAAAAADVNGDGFSDLILGARAPSGHVKVFDGRSGAELLSFFSFAGYNGPVSVGAADVDGNGLADVLVTAGGASGHVKAFDGAGGELTSFLAFPGFNGRASVTGADFDGDGFAEILVGAGGPGVGGRVAIFRTSGAVYSPGTFAFPNFNGPVSVAAGDVSGDGVPDVVVGAGGGVPGGHVKALSGTDFATVASFNPFAPSITSTIDVQVADANGDGRADILTSSQGRGSPNLSRYDAASGQVQLLLAGTNGTPPTPLPQPQPGAVIVPVPTPVFYDPFFYGFYNPIYDPFFYGPGFYDPGFYDPGYVDPGYYDPGYYDPGYYDPGYYDPGFYDPGFYDPGYVDPGFYDPGYYDPGYFYF